MRYVKRLNIRCRLQSISVLGTRMDHMNLIIKGKHKKTLIFPVFSGNSVFYSDSCLVVV